MPVTDQELDRIIADETRKFELRAAAVPDPYGPAMAEDARRAAETREQFEARYREERRTAFAKEYAAPVTFRAAAPAHRASPEELSKFAPPDPWGDLTRERR
jgi:hypothetical protein